MRRHTLIGERILLGRAGAARPWRGWCARATSAGTAAATRTGCAGDEIPLGARVVAVCDAFDAMTTERPYRQPVGPTDASRSCAAAPGRSSTRRW